MPRRWALMTSWLIVGNLIGCSQLRPGPAEEVVAACDAAARASEETQDFAYGGDPPVPVADSVLGVLEEDGPLRDAVEELNRGVRGIDGAAAPGRERNNEIGPVDRALRAAETACTEAGYDIWLLPRQ